MWLSARLQIENSGMPPPIIFFLPALNEFPWSSWTRIFQESAEFLDTFSYFYVCTVTPRTWGHSSSPVLLGGVCYQTLMRKPALFARSSFKSVSLRLSRRTVPFSDALSGSGGQLAINVPQISRGGVVGERVRFQMRDLIDLLEGTNAARLQFGRRLWFTIYSVKKQPRIYYTLSIEALPNHQEPQI